MNQYKATYSTDVHVHVIALVGEMGGVMGIHLKRI